MEYSVDTHSSLGKGRKSRYVTFNDGADKILCVIVS